jgi:hypothetical protein
MTIQTSDAKWLEEIMKSIRSVTNGHVQIVIQDSRVVQIETAEKRRLT